MGEGSLAAHLLQRVGPRRVLPIDYCDTFLTQSAYAKHPNPPSSP
jgi:hypothetical protein